MRAMKLFPLMAALALTVSACDPQVIEKPIFPSRADVEAMTEAKPIPPVEIATDEEAAVQHDADLESWGERLHSAGARVCRWFNFNGADFDCPAMEAE